MRALPLTLLLVAAGAFLATPAALELLENFTAYRQAVLWGVPAACLALSLILFPRLPGPAGEGPGSRRLFLLAGCAAALVVDQSFLGVGYLAGWATFTFGSQELADERLILHALWGLPACLALGVWGWERALRGAVYAGWRRRLPRAGAAALSILAGTALGLPAVLPGGEVRDDAFVAASLAAVLAREISFLLLFTRGGLLVAGVYRGAFAFVEAFAVNDWLSVYFPSYNYVAAGPAFYAARAAAALLALGVVAAFARRPAGGGR